MNDRAVAASVASEQSHTWAWDEGSSGAEYEFCTRCGQDRDFLAPNEYHGWLPCERRAQQGALISDYEREHGAITQAEMDALAEQPGDPESAREHGARTRHSTHEGLDRPWTCDDCPARSPLWDLTVAQATRSAPNPYQIATQSEPSEADRG